MKLLSKIPKKALIATATAGTAIAVGVAVAIPKEESYRVIQVYDIEGTAQVTREDMGLMDAYVNMQLQNQDDAETGSDSYVQMKMDEDKYLLMEPDTCVSIEATGNDIDSKTKIVLTKGAIVNRIEKKLSENSTYEVETPNSTMAVRGTQFRVAISEPDENGNVYTTLEVYDGSVESVINEINPDGSITQKKLTIEAGKKVTIRGTLKDAEYLGDIQDIVYDYDNPVLDFIGYMVEEQASSEEMSSSSEEESSSLEEESSSSQEESSAEPESVELSSVDLEESSSSQEMSSSSQEESSSSKEESSSSEEESSSSEEESSSSEEESSSSEEESSSSEEESSSIEEPASYTVTFIYNGNTFATQTVKANSTAAAPKLCPAASGGWNFDFSTPITQDTTVAWN